MPIKFILHLVWIMSVNSTLAPTWSLYRFWAEFLLIKFKKNNTLYIWMSATHAAGRLSPISIPYLQNTVASVRIFYSPKGLTVNFGPNSVEWKNFIYIWVGEAGFWILNQIEQESFQNNNILCRLFSQSRDLRRCWLMTQVFSCEMWPYCTSGTYIIIIIAQSRPTS